MEFSPAICFPRAHPAVRRTHCQYRTTIPGSSKSKLNFSSSVRTYKPQAQADYTTLSKDLPNLTQSPASTSALAQAFTQLGKDLQSGNLQAAQSDFAAVQQDVQQVATQAHGHRHHHHHSEDGESAATGKVTSPIAKDFSTLAQDLQAGNLSGAQSAFAALQNDLQNIGGFYPAGSTTATGASGSATQPSCGGVSVSA